MNDGSVRYDVRLTALVLGPPLLHLEEEVPRVLYLPSTEEAFEDDIIGCLRGCNAGLGHLPQQVERARCVLDAAPSVGEGVVRDNVRGEAPLESADEGGGLAGMARLPERVEEGVEQGEILHDAVGAVEREEEADGDVGPALRRREALEEDGESARGEGQAEAREEREDGVGELAGVAEARGEVEREVDGAGGDGVRAGREVEERVEEEERARRVVPEELEDAVGDGRREGRGDGEEGRREGAGRCGGEVG